MTLKPKLPTVFSLHNVSYALERSLSGPSTSRWVGLYRSSISQPTSIPERVVVKFAVQQDEDEVSNMERECANLEWLEPMLREGDRPLLPYLLDQGEIESGGSILRVLLLNYVEGETLEERLNGELSPRQFMRTLRLLVSILARLERLGVQHGDIKPKNVLIHGNDHVMLLDLESASTRDSFAPNIRRTAPYFPPETAFTLTRDSYALGAWLRREIPASKSLGREQRHLSEEAAYDDWLMAVTNLAFPHAGEKRARRFVRLLLRLDHEDPNCRPLPSALEAAFNVLASAAAPPLTTKPLRPSYLVVPMALGAVLGFFVFSRDDMMDLTAGLKADFAAPEVATTPSCAPSTPPTRPAKAPAPTVQPAEKPPEPPVAVVEAPPAEAPPTPTIRKPAPKPAKLVVREPEPPLTPDCSAKPRPEGCAEEGRKSGRWGRKRSGGSDDGAALSGAPPPRQEVHAGAELGARPRLPLRHQSRGL